MTLVSKGFDNTPSVIDGCGGPSMLDGTSAKWLTKAQSQQHALTRGA